MNYPRVWENKTSKQKIRVMPWWEIPEPDKDLTDMIQKEVPEYKVKFGVLVQVGYLLENAKGLWLGAGPQIAEFFEDLGEWRQEQQK